MPTFGAAVLGGPAARTATPSGRPGARVVAVLRRTASRLRLTPRQRAIATSAGFGLVDLILFSSVLTMRDPLMILLLVGYAALGATALVWRRGQPIRVFALVWAHAVVAHLLPALRYQPIMFVLVAVHAVAFRRGRGHAAGALAMLAALVPAGFAVAFQVRTHQPASERSGILLANTLFYGALVAFAWGRGAWSRICWNRGEELRQAAAREAVQAERGWIAQEVHDTVAHAVTVMVLHSAGAQRVLGTDADRARECLATIEDVGKQTMTELRHLLDVLRPTEPDFGAGGGASRGYRLGLKDLDSLMARIEVAGVTVRRQSQGQARELPPEVDLAAYRTVQEALTNVTKHCGSGATATVRLTWRPDLLTVRVADDGCGSRDHRSGALSTGHGLLGLGERITLLGGRLVVGPVEQGGFAVTADLPYRHG